MSRLTKTLLTIFLLTSFIIKLILIFEYKNQLTLSSDDLNYIKSAAFMAERGILTYQNFNEPTVFIMPLYPMLLAVIFKFLGAGIIGLQTIRVIQAVLSTITVLMVFLIARNLINDAAGLVASALMSFYLPNITTAGYILTETLFTTLLCVLVFMSLTCPDRFKPLRIAAIALIWTLAVLSRPTIAFYPLFLLIYFYINNKYKLKDIVKSAFIMLAVFIFIMSPWWIRNYKEYGTFIPLTASSGNPMLQGTYIDYNQTPQNTTYYKLGKNSLETDRIEVNLAKKRIHEGFKKDFWAYLKWYTAGKTLIFWRTIFYWKEFFGISQYYVQAMHYILLYGFVGMVLLLIKDFKSFIIPAALIIYFNIVHCVYMAFDRYAFPVLPMLSVFCAYFLIRVFNASFRALLQNLSSAP